MKINNINNLSFTCAIKVTSDINNSSKRTDEKQENFFIL